MELKEFIVHTITAIADATVELQTSLEKKGATVNPPTTPNGSDSYIPGNGSYIHRRVQDVQFDVAVTTRAEGATETKVGLKVYVLEARAGENEKSSVETANRVKFAVPIALTASNDEQANRLAKELNHKAAVEMSRSYPGGRTDPFR